MSVACYGSAALGRKTRNKASHTKGAPVYKK